jgi:hypothetical protein
MNWAESIRKNMGYTHDFAQRMDLIHMTPSDDLSSSGYCLANKGREYLVYLPTDSAASVDLSGVSGKFKVEWFDPSSGTTSDGEEVQGGNKLTFTPPFHTGSAVLYMKME